MKKDILSVLTKILYIVFIIETIILMWIVYNHIAGKIALYFGISYIFLTLFLIVYVPIVTIFNLKKLKWSYVRKRFFSFFILFVVFGALNYTFDYIFRPSSINLFRNISIALGLAFGISFSDVVLKKVK
ncbi:hypothetical protein [Clostridium scatologenes]|uniref:Uncharacterized protein n=1 Tax=Clostridium scatologenes TaxID=1548 RepID=A0A0E3GQ94_CLOSL|nr:hypothetical protein [Clostridium scatologenes]AKA68176.1 hypothetical protein CSCA_1051 [Clostridium scatologenes]